MFIGREGAHAFYVSIFREVEHLRELKAGEPHPRLCTSEPLTKPRSHRMSLAEKNREGANIVRPKKWRPLNLGLIGRQKRFFARVPGGKTGTKAATSSARRGALAICDVTASATYHIACDANMNIASRDTMAQNRPKSSAELSIFGNSERFANGRGGDAGGTATCAATPR